MKLVICEKKSVAQSVAQAIGAREKREAYLEGNGYIVSWCMGHLVEMSPPEAYDAKLKKWSYETLPIIPSNWEYQLREEGRKQFEVLKKLMYDKRVA